MRASYKWLRELLPGLSLGLRHAQADTATQSLWLQSGSMAALGPLFIPLEDRGSVATQWARQRINVRRTYWANIRYR